MGLLHALLAIGCDLGSESVTMRIDHYREPCWGAGPDFCLRVLDTSHPDLSAPRRIEGFQHEWGWIYELEVLVHDADPSLAADGFTRYELLDVVSRERVADDSTFTLSLTGDFVARVDGVRFDLVGGVSAQCDDAAVCRTMADALRSETLFEIALSHPPDPGGRFVAHAITMQTE